MNNKTIITVGLLVILLGVGGWYLFINPGTSQAKKIAQIASTTEAEVETYTTSTQQNLQYDLKQWQVDEVSDDTKSIEIFNLPFSSLWGQPQSIDNRETVAEITFSNNRSILVTKPSDQSGQAQRYLKDIENGRAESTLPPSQLFEQILGKGYSGYDLMKYILNSKLSDVENANNAQSAQARSYAISSRSTFARSGQPYEFSTDSIKGFIFESLQQTELWVWINNRQFTVTVDNGNNSSKVSKEVVDTLISSLQSTEVQADKPDKTDNYFAD